MSFFSNNTYSKSYLMGLGKRWGINAEAGHLIEKGIPVRSNGDGTYTTDASIDMRKVLHERDKLTRSIRQHIR